MNASSGVILSGYATALMCASQIAATQESLGPKLRVKERELKSEDGQPAETADLCASHRTLSRRSFVGSLPWAESAYANRGQERTVTLLRQSSAGITLDASVSVMILYADPVVAAGLAAVLNEHTDFQIIPTLEPRDFGDGPPPADVVLADYEAAMYLAERAPQWAKHVMVFTNYDSEAKISRALEIGARGYLLHGVGLQELFEGIRCVHGGGVALSPLVTLRVTNRIACQTLTAREKAVLELLMLGLRNKAIARRLNLCVGTVKTHVKSILQKLEADSRTAAVITAQRRGVLP